MSALTKVDALFAAVQTNDAARINAAIDAIGSSAIEFEDAKGRTPLLAAIDCGKDIAIQTLLNRGADITNKGGISLPPLIYAAKLGSRSSVKILLDNHANIHANGPEGPALTYAVDNDDHKLAKLLLRRGSNPNWTALNGRTLLFFFTSKEMAELLLKHGADIDAHDHEGDTALHHAVLECSAKKVQFLLDLGANPDAVNLAGQTPLMTAADINCSWRIGFPLLRAGSEPKDHSKIVEWLGDLKKYAAETFPEGRLPAREKCFTDGKISDDVLDACVTGQFTTLIAAPLIASKDPKDRQLLQDIWDQLPQYWQNRYGSLHTQFVKAGGLQPVMGRHTGAVASGTDAVRRIV